MEPKYKIPPLLVGNQLATDLSVKANLFNGYFSQKCTAVDKDSSILPNITFATEQKLSTSEFCTDDIVKIVKSLDPSKALPEGLTKNAKLITDDASLFSDVHDSTPSLVSLNNDLLRFLSMLLPMEHNIQLRCLKTGPKGCVLSKSNHLVTMQLFTFTMIQYLGKFPKASWSVS